jgi:amino acid adenylation domain-containing protein
MLLHELLSHSAEKVPERPAVRYREQEISYGVLARWSDRLAARLSNQGIGPGDRVGIFLDKSIDAVAAVFGILKSGACYVPLDPVGPHGRQAAILKDCRIDTLVSSTGKFPRLSRILKIRPGIKKVLCTDDTGKSKNKLPGNIQLYMEPVDGLSSCAKQPWTPRPLDGDALAYILYTSGSTGSPKGVMISHRAASSFVDWAHSTFEVSYTDVLSGHAPFHFDLSIFDIFVAIKAGATLCLVPQGVSAFPASLADFMDREKISVWYSVPSALVQLVVNDSLEGKKLSSMKKILSAGEVFPSKYLRRLMQLVPRAEYYNLYGPTETNVCTWYHVEKPPEADDPVPIGRPCNGQVLYVLDENGQEVQAGSLGELYVHGPTLMTGYFGHPENTRKCMLTRSPGTMEKPLYATGDLVRYDAAGYLEFHGRSDDMIKSRGYRIELGEIEAVLAGHPDIRAAAAFGIPDGVIGNRILAVVMKKTSQEISVNSLKSYCSGKLPGYMIPGEIRFVSDLPRTSTGKIDKKTIENSIYYEK